MASEPPVPEDRGLLAAEYALGLLEADERAAAAALAERDPAFAAEVAAWEARFAAFYAEIAPVVPDRDLWPLIAARLPQVPANDAAPSVLPWKIATGIFGSIAAALALVLVTQPAPPVPTPTPAPQPTVAPVPSDILVAQLVAGDGASMLAAAVDPAANVRINATAIPAGSGEPELWVIPEGGAPVSVGQIARTGEFTIRLTPEQQQLMRDGATLALTLEPADGVPHAAPTGAILGTARITRL
jgi:anti-sigma-K factor RskA